LSKTAAVLQTTSTMNGRILFAQTAVTLQMVNITLWPAEAEKKEKTGGRPSRDASAQSRWL
jgi:hypothetical protein